MNKNTVSHPSHCQNLSNISRVRLRLQHRKALCSRFCIHMIYYLHRGVFDATICTFALRASTWLRSDKILFIIFIDFISLLTVYCELYLQCFITLCFSYSNILVESRTPQRSANRRISHFAAATCHYCTITVCTTVVFFKSRAQASFAIVVPSIFMICRTI